MNSLVGPPHLHLFLQKEPVPRCYEDYNALHLLYTRFISVLVELLTATLYAEGRLIRQCSRADWLDGWLMQLHIRNACHRVCPPLIIITAGSPFPI